MEFQAKNVYLVLSWPGNYRVRCRCSWMAARFPAADAGTMCTTASVTVEGERLYTLVRCRATNATARPRFAPGVTGYAFTFG